MPRRQQQKQRAAAFPAAPKAPPEPCMVAKTAAEPAPDLDRPAPARPSAAAAADSDSDGPLAFPGAAPLALPPHLALHCFPQPLGRALVATRPIPRGSIVLEEAPLLVLPPPAAQSAAAQHVGRGGPGQPQMAAVALGCLRGALTAFAAAPPAVQAAVADFYDGEELVAAGDPHALALSQTCLAGAVQALATDRRDLQESAAAAEAAAACSGPGRSPPAPPVGGGGAAILGSPGVLQGWSASTLELVLRIRALNCHEYGPAGAGALFPAGSKLAHACAPNAHFATHLAAAGEDEVAAGAGGSPGGSPGGSAPGSPTARGSSGGPARPPFAGPGVFRALRAIGPGELVTVDYVGGESALLPVPLRGLMLRKSKLFACDCRRCTQEPDACRALPCPACWGEADAGRARAAPRAAPHARQPAGRCRGLLQLSIGNLPSFDAAPASEVGLITCDMKRLCEGHPAPWGPCSACGRSFADADGALYGDLAAAAQLRRRVAVLARLPAVATQLAVVTRGMLGLPQEDPLDALGLDTTALADAAALAAAATPGADPIGIDTPAGLGAAAQSEPCGRSEAQPPSEADSQRPPSLPLMPLDLALTAVVLAYVLQAERVGVSNLHDVRRVASEVVSICGPAHGAVQRMRLLLTAVSRAYAVAGVKAAGGAGAGVVGSGEPGERKAAKAPGRGASGAGGLQLRTMAGGEAAAPHADGSAPTTSGLALAIDAAAETALHLRGLLAWSAAACLGREGTPLFESLAGALAPAARAGAGRLLQVAAAGIPTALPTAFLAACTAVAIDLLERVAASWGVALGPDSAGSRAVRMELHLARRLLQRLKGRAPPKQVAAAEAAAYQRVFEASGLSASSTLPPAREQRSPAAMGQLQAGRAPQATNSAGPGAELRAG